MNNNELAQELMFDARRCRSLADDASSPEVRCKFISMAENYEDALANLLAKPLDPQKAD